MSEDAWEYLGWVGIKSQVLHYLRIVGADRDEEGRFLIKGDVMTFLGLGGENAETLVGAKTVYYSNGKSCGLAAGLRSTSYGSAAYVIM